MRGQMALCINAQQGSLVDGFSFKEELITNSYLNGYYKKIQFFIVPSIRRRLGSEYP
jgi:hypothetical protein